MQDAQEEFGSQQQDIASKILPKMAPMIVKYSQENGFGMIVDTSKPWPQSNVAVVGRGGRHHQDVVEAYNVQSGVAAPAPPAGGRYEASGSKSSGPDSAESRRLRSRPSRRNSLEADTSRVRKVPQGRVTDAAFFLCAQGTALRSCWCP